VADAISRAGSAEPAAIQQALAATEGYEGVTGTIAYPGDSQVPSKPVAIMHVEDGKVSFETTVTPKS
jgi:branched-chain amino acid transport system substrate-binding protein